MTRVDSLISARPLNAVLSWLLVSVLVASMVVDLLEGAVLWAGFTAAVITIAVVPAVVSADVAVTASWEILVLSALPAFARIAGVFVSPLGYLSIAALGLLVVAEIDQFTAATLPGWFAATMVLMTTMTVASTWVIVRYVANLWVDTGFATSVNALMWDLVIATGVGLSFGVLFELVLREAEAH